MKKAMFKVMAVLGIATIAATGFGACGQITEGSNTENVYATFDPQVSFMYSQVTPDDEIVKGDSTAVNTISNFLGKNVEHGSDYPRGSGVRICGMSRKETDEKYMVYSVYDYKEDNDLILYLFRDDTEVVAATESANTFNNDEEFLVDGWNDPQNHNELNYNETYNVFAFHSEGKADAIMTESAGTCTSIWAYNADSNAVHRIWCDTGACPIWAF